MMGRDAIAGRYLSARTLRNFLRTDPIGIFLQKEPTMRLQNVGGYPYDLHIYLNLYTYCGDNPVIFFDPYGLFSWDTGDAVGYTVAGAAVGAATGGTLTVGSCTLPGWVAGAIVGGGGYVIAWGVSNTWDAIFSDKQSELTPPREPGDPGWETWMGP